jgi:iron(III) transport system ATP-binding protein
MPGLRLTDLSKRFGKTVGVQRLSLEILDGELLTLLGPSGCGKTTTLRCVAGLLTPDSGEIYLGEERITDLPPERRGIGLVFQNYALWPHMTVYGNLAFGLQLKGVPKQDRTKKIGDALATVRLSGLEERYPRQLSGGQQQRIALARALVLEPRLLLLDEPLSNLDAQLREEMRFEIRELQHRLGVTTVYVTHDQSEALALSDRIAVLHEGSLVQVGPPHEIYSRPENRFVAGFIGLTSFLEGAFVKPEEPEEFALVKLGESLKVRVLAGEPKIGEKVTLAVRPEHIRMYPGRTGAALSEGNLLEAEVLQVAYLGNALDYRLQLGDWVVRAQTDTDKSLEPGQKVWIAVSPEQVTLVAPASS